MPSIITRDLRYFNSLNLMESLSEVTPDQVFLFFGKSTVWADEANPDTPIDSTQNRIQVYQDLTAMKRISSNDVSIVLSKISWTANEVYDQYDDIIDLVEGINPITLSPYDFYVITDDFNAYKCISNNNGAASTVKPTGTSVTSFQTADGYVWKFMLDIVVSDALKYATDEWVPVKRLDVNDASNQWSVQSSAVDGSIESIEMVVEGSGYNPSLPPAIIITGDGVSATATPVIEAGTGAIKRILMNNIGSGYTNATITIDITGTTGTGGQARAILSPIGGHGSNPVEELGGKYAMIKQILSGDESGNMPINIDYRQIGLIVNPELTENGIVLDISSVSGSFDVSDAITGQTSGATGMVVKYDFYKQKLFIRVTSGSFAVAESIQDDVDPTKNATVDATAVSNLPLTDQYALGGALLAGKGQVIYINNRTKITRIDVQDEEARFVISF